MQSGSDLIWKVCALQNKVPLQSFVIVTTEAIAVNNVMRPSRHTSVQCRERAKFQWCN